MANEPMSAATALRCPKCEAPMRTYERDGVHVDRCTVWEPQIGPLAERFEAASHEG